jgi:hypothetical protein
MSRAAVTRVTRHSLGDRAAVTGTSHPPLVGVRPTARRPKVPAALSGAAYGRPAASVRRSVTPSEGGCSR